ncbi:MAG: hypothetical protein JWR11_3598 [Mycobacterium sp.]|nr:hypothetical protein [Mycobacterium sp.]
MWTTYIALEDQYLDVSPTALLVIATVSVGSLILCLLTETAAAWVRSYLKTRHHR